jgi:hypothetical protein
VEAPYGSARVPEKNSQLFEELNIRIRQPCKLLFNPLKIKIMATTITTKSIVKKLPPPPPPPPIQMRVIDYIKLLSKLEKMPVKRQAVLDALKKYDDACVSAGKKLHDTINRILVSK